MTNLLDVVRRTHPPVAWAEGDNIPWNDPSFSERMLREHLDQSHDLASRRLTTIDRHVDWIHREVLRGQRTKLLDLGCGPGLYTNRLAQLGHECVGVDFSPASVAYATEAAKRDELPCSYQEADVRCVVPANDFGLVMMLYAQLNVFRRSEAADLLSRAHDALEPGGKLLLEPQTYEHVKTSGSASPSWHTSPEGLFSAHPHLVLQESFWDETTRTSTIRFYVLEAESGTVTRHALSNEAYTNHELRSMVLSAGFEEARILPSLTGKTSDADPHTLVVLAKK